MIHDTHVASTSTSTSTSAHFINICINHDHDDIYCISRIPTLEPIPEQNRKRKREDEDSLVMTCIICQDGNIQTSLCCIVLYIVTRC